MAKQKQTIEERVANYEEIRKIAAELYSTFKPVECPALDQKVTFPSEGFNHLVYASPKKMRDKRAQILRFDMLPRAKIILEQSTTYQEYEEEIVNKKINRRGKWIYDNVLTRNWGFIAIINKFRVKVVVTQEGNGSIKFLSVQPAWITRWYRDIKLIENSVGTGLDESDDIEILKNTTQGGVS